MIKSLDLFGLKLVRLKKSGNLVFIFFLAPVKFLPEGQVTGLGSDGNVFS